jgi:hypothetical protein
MPEQELKTTLQALRLELDKVHFEHETSRQTVDDSIRVLEEKLREESFMSGDEYLVHELGEALSHAVEQFEENHPELTDLIGRLSDLINKMGI